MTVQLENPRPDLEPDLADRMRKSLRVSDVPVQEMADYLEVNRNTIGRWINGHNSPSVAVMRLWALRTGVPFEWLRYGWAPRDSNPEPTGSVVDLFGRRTHKKPPGSVFLHVSAQSRGDSSTLVS